MLSKKTNTGFFSSSALVSKKPCWLFGASGGSVRTTAESITFYDGFNDGAAIKMKLYGNKPAPIICFFKRPMYFASGLYIKLSGNMVSVGIHYKTDN